MECPVQPKIPVYLFVGGAVGLVSLLQILYDQWRKHRKDEFDASDIEGMVSNPTNCGSSILMNIAVALFLLIWFGFGNYWVFKIWKPNFTQPPREGSSRW
jgi:hypothetical protein